MDKAKEYLDKVEIKRDSMEFYPSYYEHDINKALEISYLHGIMDGQQDEITGEIELPDGSVTNLNDIIDKLYNLIEN